MLFYIWYMLVLQNISHRCEETLYLMTIASGTEGKWDEEETNKIFN